MPKHLRHRPRLRPVGPPERVTVEAWDTGMQRQEAVTQLDWVASMLEQRCVQQANLGLTNATSRSMTCTDQVQMASSVEGSQPH